MQFDSIAVLRNRDPVIDHGELIDANRAEIGARKNLIGPVVENRGETSVIENAESPNEVRASVNGCECQWPFDDTRFGDGLKCVAGAGWEPSGVHFIGLGWGEFDDGTVQLSFHVEGIAARVGVDAGHPVFIRTKRRTVLIEDYGGFARIARAFVIREAFDHGEMA